MKAPVLKISQAMIAILAQYKDPQGSVLVLKSPDAKNGHVMEVVFKLETLVQSFTTFAATVIPHPSSGNDQIMLVTPLHDKIYVPKLWVLNPSASGLQEDMIIESGRSVNSNNKEGMDKKGPMPLPKSDPPGKKIVENPNVTLSISNLYRETSAASTFLKIT
jgi:hypothetical protein